MTDSQPLIRNRRAFLRIGMLATGVAVLAACGAGATTKSSLTNEERLALEALGDEMAAAIVADTTPKEKIKGTSMESGIVKWYNAAKGYGFIEREGGKDVFFHSSAIEEGVTLQEGQQVEFEVVLHPKGLWAGNVTLVR